MLFSTLHAFKITKEVYIGIHTFTLIEESYNEYGQKGVTMALYTKGTNVGMLRKLNFSIRNESGPCSDKNVEEGHYVINKDSITLYSHWKRSRSSDNTPIGDRIQVYKLNKHASFYLSDSKIYIEKSRRNKDTDEGMKYLYTEVKTKYEKVLLDSYVSNIEETFKAKFVLGDEARVLAKEVKKALMQKEKQRWK
ncbi:MAG: hypothetical protein DRQ78_00930 [Epsilonproteobacteria bacterium]|nr:MAG: hypothetical protein DRQ78_00930 [Campylobacterota bacterium]